MFDSSFCNTLSQITCGILTFSFALTGYRVIKRAIRMGCAIDDEQQPLRPSISLRQRIVFPFRTAWAYITGFIEYCEEQKEILKYGSFHCNCCGKDVLVDDIHQITFDQIHGEQVCSRCRLWSANKMVAAVTHVDYEAW